MGSLTIQRDEGWAVDTAMASKAKTKAPEQTFDEAKFLKHLVESKAQVRIRLGDNEEVADPIVLARSPSQR